jgi:hypothetical protein
VTIVYLEAEDVERALAGLGSSQHPIDRWWREQIRAVHRIDPARPVPGPPNEQIIDFHDGSHVSAGDAVAIPAAVGGAPS